MSEPFIGEMRLAGYNFAPKGWAKCDGQILTIHDNAALYSLLGISYGGDARTTFNLPNMQGRTPVHPGPVNYAYKQGVVGGSDYVTLTASEMPAHRHNFYADQMDGSTFLPFTPSTKVGNVLAASDAEPYYTTESPDTALNPATVSYTGSGTSHSNIQPSACVLFIIALTGLYPSRN